MGNYIVVKYEEETKTKEKQMATQKRETREQV